MKWFNFLRMFTLCSIFLSVSSCQNKNTTDSSTSEFTTSGMEGTTATDSTHLGVSIECGMSTFCMVDYTGDTLWLTRSSEDGTDGIFYGDILEGNRYAVITSADNQAVVSAINITEIERFTNDYLISNGKLILTDKQRSYFDTVSIVSLNQDSFVFEGIHGKKKLLSKQ